MAYCDQCGAKLKEGANFCEKCGKKVGAKQAAPQKASAGQSRQAKGGLFDINRNYYILKEKYWDWGSGDILDENNQPIGKMKRKIFSIRKKVDLVELDGTVKASIHAKLISARSAQDLKDGQDNLIARIKKKILAIKPKFYLEDPEGNEWYEAQGNFMGFSFKVKDLSTGKVVAEIEKADRWRDVFLGGLYDFKDTYALRILDNETDRRILLGFTLSIDNVLHDVK